MLSTLKIFDDFCPAIAVVRDSALQSGFGTWRPNKGEIGSSVYDGMNFWGKHSMMLHSLACAMGRPVYPNSTFFRVTNKETEKAYVHSDRESGSWTCVAYLSEHKEASGTGFYRHRKSGLVEMPTFEKMRHKKRFAALKRDMVKGGDKEWEQLDFVRGVFNRAVVFRAPLFHARCPKNGFGTTAEGGRMVWVTHFEME